MEPLPPTTEAVDSIWPWGTRTLRGRLAEPRFRQEGGPDNPFEEENEPIDVQVIRSALDRTLQAQLAELTSYRTEGEGEAFRVRDFSWMGVAYSSHPRDALELRVGCETGGFVDHLRKKRSEGLWRGREIDVQEVTPSAVTTVLMSTVKNEYADTFPFDIWVLRRHLSTTAFYGMRVENPSLFYCLGITYCTRDPTTRHIKEKKLTLALTSIRKRAGNTTLILNDLPWQLTAYCAPLPRQLLHEGDEFRIAEWTVRCFLKVAEHWGDVLDEIDTQVHRKGAISIQQLSRTARCDPNPYIRALELVEDTLPLLREHMSYIPLLTGEVLPRSWPTKRGCAALYEFEQLSRRIKRKMQEVQEAALIAEAERPATEAEVEVQVGSSPMTFGIAFFPALVILLLFSSAAGEFLGCFVFLFTACILLSPKQKKKGDPRG